MEPSTSDGLEPLAEQLGRLPVLRLAFGLEAGRDGALPRYLGSTIRGGLAWSLRHLSCALPREQCETCRLGERCAYGYLFETRRPAQAERFPDEATIPHPIVIEPPAPSFAPYAPGSRLELGVTLLGRAAEHAARLVVAAQDMGRQGLGTSRLPFRLVDARVRPLRGEPSPYYREGQPLGAVQPEPLSRHLEGRAPADEVTLKLLTPTRFAEGGRLTRTPTFRTIVSSLLRRASALLAFHADQPLALDFRGLLDRAVAVRTVRSTAELIRLDRFSNRQDRKVPLDGLVGEMTFRGEGVREAWPLLVAGEIVHGGKGTVFGLGRMGVTATGCDSGVG